MTKYIQEGEQFAPQGERFEVGFCGECPAAHIMVFDKKDLMICQFTITKKQCKLVIGFIEERDPNFREITLPPIGEWRNKKRDT